MNAIPVDVVPPHDLVAERSIVGAMLNWPDDVLPAIQIDPNWCYDDRHRTIAECAIRLHGRGDVVDPITVGDALAACGRLQLAGGAAYLSEVVESVPYAIHTRRHAAIVREKWQRRQLIQRCRAAMAEAYLPDSDIGHVIRQSVEALTEAVESTDRPAKFGGRTPSELWGLADQPVEWLVHEVFSVSQPTIFGAKQKSLKTTLLTDLAVSLASGLDWLGRFKIPTRQRVLFITGESSETAAIRKIRRAAGHRNLRAEDLDGWLRVEARDFPNLPSAEDCLSVHQTVLDHGITVVVCDPLYMGLQGINTSNLAEVGPAMRGFMDACRPASVVIAHHIKKSASYDDAPNLEDLSQAGIAEFAGNYWLMGRMAEYTGDGAHQLAIRYGGRDEQFGLLKMEFDERKWSAEISDLLDHRADQRQRKENERANAMSQKILQELTRYPDGCSESKLATAIGTRTERGPYQTALQELEARGSIVCLPDFRPPRSQPTKGWKLSQPS